MSLRRSCYYSLLLALLTGTLGCSMMPHALQPSQLRKLNRGPALGRDTTNFSIPDPEVPRGFADLPEGSDPFRTGSESVVQ